MKKRFFICSFCIITFNCQSSSIVKAERTFGSIGSKRITGWKFSGDLTTFALLNRKKDQRIQNFNFSYMQFYAEKQIQKD
jgi:hypothetical protein